MKNSVAVGVYFATAVLGLPATHAEPNLLSTRTLYQACSSGAQTKEHALCTGFIAGVASAALAATRVGYIALGEKGPEDAASAAKAAGLVFGCGEAITVQDTIKAFVAYVDDHPETKDDIAITTLTDLMADKYKCS